MEEEQDASTGKEQVRRPKSGRAPHLPNWGTAKDTNSFSNTNFRAKRSVSIAEASNTTSEDHLFTQKAARWGLSLAYTEIFNEEYILNTSYFFFSLY